MSKITITDFLIKLGFDATEVQKGVKTLEKEFAPLNKKLSKEAVKQTKQQKAKNNELRLENKLSAKRLAIQKNIDKLKASGHTGDVKSLTGSLRGKDMDKLEAARVRSAKILHGVEKEIAATKSKAAKVAAKERADRLAATAKVKADKVTAKAVKADKVTAEKLVVKQKIVADPLKQENRIEAKRLSVQKNIDKLSSKGHTSSIDSLKQDLGSNDINKLERARLRSAQTLREVENGIAQKKAQSAKISIKELAEKRAYAQEEKQNTTARIAREKAAAAEAKVVAREKIATAKADAAEIARIDRANIAKRTAMEKVARTNARMAKAEGQRVESTGLRRMGFEDQLTGLSKKLDIVPVTPESAEAIKTLRKEIALLNAKGGVAKTRKEFALLKREYKDVAHRASLVTKAQTKMRRDMRATEFAAKSLKDSVMNMSRSYLSVFAAIGATASFVRTGQELTSLKATLLGVSGTSEGAAKDFDFVSDASKRLGVDITEATSAYGKLGAAAKSAGLDNAEARNAFLAASELSTAFNLSTSDFEGVSRAMSQILSKGKLSTEELLQLGERVPIAFSSAAKALGVSTKELFKQIESGAIQSVDFLPDFADEVREYVRQTGMLDESLKTSRVAMNRFITNYKLNVSGAFDEGLDSGLGEFFNSLSNIMEEMNPLFRMFGDVLGGVFDVISPILSMAWQLIRLITVPLAGAFNTMSDSLDKPVESMNLLEQALYGVWTVLKTLAAVVVYPFAKLEEGLDWLDDWFANTDSTLDKMAVKAGNLTGSPAGLTSSFRASDPSTTANNTTNVSQQNAFTIEGSKDPEAVSREIQSILEQQFSASVATGY